MHLIPFYASALVVRDPQPRYELEARWHAVDATSHFMIAAERGRLLVWDHDEVQPRALTTMAGETMRIRLSPDGKLAIVESLVVRRSCTIDSDDNDLVSVVELASGVILKQMEVFSAKTRWLDARNFVVSQREEGNEDWIDTFYRVER